MSISDRYGDVAALQALRSNAVIDGLLAHRSVRAYLPDPLPEGTIETLVAAAQSAPTSSNLQVWSVVAVEDPDRKAGLAALAGNQKHILEAPLLLVWLIDFDRLTQIGAAAERTPHALDYTESFLLGAVDTALAAQNVVVALEALGLGSVYIGGIRNRPAEVAELLDLPPRVFPLVGLVVGHPDPARPASIKPRLPQSTVLYRERYEWSEASHDAVQGYDRTLRAFQEREGMPPLGWRELALRRTAGPQSMAGREVLKAVLENQGFALL